MKVKLIAALCCLLLICCFSGYSLAREEIPASSHEDKLIGVYITTSYLDLFDMEGYLKDNIRGFGGGELIIEGQQEQYQGRIYGELQNITLTSEDDGQTTEIQEYQFRNIPGIAFFAPRIPAKEGQDSYISSNTGEGLCDSKLGLSYRDEQESMEMEGHIYVTPAARRHTFYFNPVYQSGDGSVYLISGSGFAIHEDNDSAGSVSTQTLESSTTVTENGQVTTYHSSVKISVSTVFPAQKIVLLQLDGDSRLLSRKEYTPQTLPEQLEAGPDTAFMIMESHNPNSSSQIQVKRTLYEEGAEQLESFVARPDGICLQQYTPILWQ